MANKAMVWSEFGKATHLSEATFGKMDRGLIAAGLAPHGGQGGGRNAVHADEAYLAHMIIGAGFPFPSQAALIVREAYSVVHFLSARQVRNFESDQATGAWRAPIANLPPVDDPPRGKSLAAYIMDRIREFAEMPSETRGEQLTLPHVRGSVIRLDFDPLSANVEQMSSDGGMVIHFFSKGDTDALKGMPALEFSSSQDAALAPIRRSGVLPYTLLIVAGGLLADSWAQRSERLPFSGQGEATSTATSKTETSAAGNKKAPGLPQPRASRTKNQPREPHAAGTSNTRQTKRVCVNYQAHTGSRGITPFPMEMPYAYEVRPV